MIIGQYSIAEASIAQTIASGGGKKVPPKRTTQAIADRQLAPEPR